MGPGRMNRDRHRSMMKWGLGGGMEHYFQENKIAGRRVGGGGSTDHACMGNSQQLSLAEQTNKQTMLLIPGLTYFLLDNFEQ